MTNFKGTTGEIDFGQKHFDQIADTISLYQNGDLIMTTGSSRLYDHLTNDINKENMRLVSDAFSVRQKINFDLPELLKQRNEMLEILEQIIKEYDMGIVSGIDSLKVKQLIKEGTEI